MWQAGRLTGSSPAAGHRLEKRQGWGGFSVPRVEGAGDSRCGSAPRVRWASPLSVGLSGCCLPHTVEPTQRGAPSPRLLALSTAKSHQRLTGWAGQRVRVSLDDPVKEGGRFCVASGRPGDMGQMCLEQTFTSTPPASGVRRLHTEHLWGPGPSPIARWWLSWTRLLPRGPGHSCQHLGPCRSQGV